ncbi:hypothetical protein ALC53_02674 [Atta colombica]|uniref:Uncharacterized protein n=1 Tax=Atta colombica TaxID=520822 RepID=A0A195BQN6_9HYME|nr:hypothetical protein ALC53_02674 [Atta colombica]
MARDSRRADPRRVVAVNGGGGGGDGGATVRCKLELILLTLLLTIIIPPAYAESQVWTHVQVSLELVIFSFFSECSTSREGTDKKTLKLLLEIKHFVKSIVCTIGYHINADWFFEYPNVTTTRRSILDLVNRPMVADDIGRWHNSVDIRDVSIANYPNYTLHHYSGLSAFLISFRDIDLYNIKNNVKFIINIDKVNMPSVKKHVEKHVHESYDKWSVLLRLFATVTSRVRHLKMDSRDSAKSVRSQMDAISFTPLSRTFVKTFANSPRLSQPPKNGTRRLIINLEYAKQIYLEIRLAYTTFIYTAVYLIFLIEHFFHLTLSIVIIPIFIIDNILMFEELHDWLNDDKVIIRRQYKCTEKNLFLASILSRKYHMSYKMKRGKGYEGNGKADSDFYR